METEKENREKSPDKEDAVDLKKDASFADKQDKPPADEKARADHRNARTEPDGSVACPSQEKAPLQEDERETQSEFSGNADPKNGIWKQIAPSVKTLILAFFLEEVFSLFSISSLAFRENMMWLSIILYILFLGITGAALFIVAKNTSYRDNNVIRLNEIRRKRGEQISKYRFLAEYRKYKGYLLGLALSLPLILFVLLSFAFTGGAASNFAAAVRFIFCLFFVPVSYVNIGAPLAWLVLIGVVFNVLIFGISYQLMGRRMQRQQEHIRETMRAIHGHFDQDGSDKIDI